MAEKQVRQVLNVTRQTLVALDVEMADNYFKRLLGLMGRPGLAPSQGLWIVPCKDIHSCFMRFEFDALFVDKSMQVVHLKERMRPWRFTKFVKNGHAVLELPAGTIESTGTQLGDQLEFRQP
ncbi:MAG TPA: DUF192 domain-containing protein [Coleofasciculaceae cyanobacterium]|jgi:hypothetical protein